MKGLALALVLFFIPTAVCAQQSSNCNAHRRKLKNPFTWMESNMCDEDYEAWVQPRLKDHWYKDKYFWIGTAIIGGAVAADAFSTVQTSRPGLEESNPFLGKHPSTKKVVLFSSIYFAGQTGFHVWAWHESHQDSSMAWRQIGRWGIPVGLSIVHGYAVAHNEGLPKCPDPNICKSN